MASPSTSAKTTTFALPRLRDLIEHDDEDDDDLVEEEEEEEEDDDEEVWDVGKRMSRLSVAGSDADDEDDGCGDEEDEEEEVRSDGGVQGEGEYGSQPWHPYGSPGNLNPPSSASLPGTPERGAPSSRSPWGYSKSKDYASETEAAWWPGGAHDMSRRQQHRRQRMMREVWLDRAWQMRKQRRELGELTVLVGKGGGGESPVVAMDMDEVRAFKDLGFDLPCDWTVEIPSYVNVDTGSSGGNSPAGSGSLRISSPGDDPKEVKARLKVWAQAVALTSASRLGS